MKKLLIAVIGASVLSFGTAQARVHDWRDLEAVHIHVVEAINEMERAQAANQYDMQGHGARAVEALHVAERELREAIEAAKRR